MAGGSRWLADRPTGPPAVGFRGCIMFCLAGRSQLGTDFSSVDLPYLGNSVLAIAF